MPPQENRLTNMVDLSEFHFVADISERPHDTKPSCGIHLPRERRRAQLASFQAAAGPLRCPEVRDLNQRDMHRIASSEKDTGILEKRLWAGAGRFRAGSGLKSPPHHAR